MSSANDFKGKTVIVTGGGRGIGRGLCVELHRLGAKVIAVARNPANLKTLEEESPGIETVAVDLGDWDATREAFEKLETVDMLVNNAGVYLPESFLNFTQKTFDDICAVNLKAVINVSQIVVKKMIADKRPGSIVNVSSTAGLKAMNVCSSYSILKAGLDHLTKIMSIELGPHNIRVNSVNPGPVQTDMMTQSQNPSSTADQEQEFFDAVNARVSTAKKTADVEDVVGSIVFLLSDAAAMITGTLLPVEGGYVVS